MKSAFLAILGTDSAALRGAAPGRATVHSSLAMLLLLLPAAALAIDPALCADDGVTEIPPFATGRDANGCLTLDPGNGDPPVAIQYEFFHGPGEPDWADEGFSYGHADSTGYDLGIRDLGTCRSKNDGEYCTYLMWDIRVDGYAKSPTSDPQEMKNEDIWRPTNGAPEMLYVKDSYIANGWKCKGGAWKGPNGQICNSGENSKAHTDGIQMRGTPVNDGWVIFQDSIIANANLILFLWQVQSDFGSNGSAMLQGMHIGQTNKPIGLSTHWIDDCKQRGVDPEICTQNRLQMGYNMDELWIIDVWGTSSFSLVNDIGKLVQVNTGCGRDGCDGTIGYTNGYPHPVRRNSPKGPGDCPNGLTFQVNGGSNGATFCYTSIENALNDRVTSSSNHGDCPAPYCPHKAPPFINLSATGWANAPPGTSARLAAPDLE